MPPGKGAGIGSKASVAGSSTLSVAAAGEKRGFTLPCIECSSYYPGLLLDMLSIIMALKRIMTALNPHLPFFPLVRLFTRLWHLAFDPVID